MLIMKQNNLFKSMLSDCPTQYLSSYQKPHFDIYPKTVYIPKMKVEKDRPPPGFIETLTHLKKNIPFDLFWNVEDNINRFNPWTVKIEESHFIRPDIFDRAEVIRTRPRLVISPALPIDDITNPEARKIVTDDTYISVWGKESREAVTQSSYVKAPLPNRLFPPKKVSLPHLEVEVISPEWRMHSCSWEKKQVRSGVDKNDIFWGKHIARKQQK